MAKSFFIDTTLCTGCRGCQVACKQWHDLPAEETHNAGTYQNPADLSFVTYKLVRMREVELDRGLQWLFFAEQCRHCIEAPCLETADDPSAIYQDEATGAILYTANTRNLDTAEITASCPYNIPRQGPRGTLSKCDMCNDRVHNGLLPACVQTCPTGSMNFGDREQILAQARARLKAVRARYPKATLLDPDDVNVIYLVVHEPHHYHEYALAAAHSFHVTRQVALQRMFRPMRNFLDKLA